MSTTETTSHAPNGFTTTDNGTVARCTCGSTYWAGDEATALELAANCERFEEWWERVKPAHPPTDEQIAAIAAVIRQTKAEQAQAAKTSPSSAAA